MSGRKPEHGGEVKRAEAAEKAQEKRRRDLMVTLARYSEIAFLIPAAVVVGYLLGLLGDHLLHTHWLYLVGIIFGAVAGFVSMIRQALPPGRDVAAEDKAMTEASERAEARRANEDEDGSDEQQ